MSDVNALVARQDDGGDIELVHEVVDTSFLPDSDVEIAVEYSGVNFKDALAVTPRGGVARTYPLIPGIDLAGTVRSSTSPDFAPGDRVIAHGYDIGTAAHGGYADTARLPADKVVKLSSLTTAEAAAIGTAGFTAAMSVDAIVRHGITPSDGPVLVTGATGGVGIVTVDLLAALGYEVIASTGKADRHGLLRDLGAAEIIGRLPAEGEKLRALGKARWAAVGDCVGGTTLAYALSTLQYGGIAAASGLAGSADLPTTVHPFILRGVTLAGIDSVMLGIGKRRALWARIESELTPRHLGDYTTDIAISELPASDFRSILRGAVAGRTRVRVADGF